MNMQAGCGAGENGTPLDQSTCGVTLNPYTVEGSTKAAWQSGATSITTCSTTLTSGTTGSPKHYVLANDITPAGGNGTQCLTWSFAKLGAHRFEWTYYQWLD
jgi:hypothetical protein